MTWAPPMCGTLMEEVVVDNIFSFVERDFKEALDYFYPDENYLDFNERSLGQARGNEFPLLVINPRSNLIEQSADDAKVLEPIRIENYLKVVADNAENVTRLIMRYTKVYDAVLRAAAEFAVCKRDYFAGVNPASITTPSIVIGHTYGGFRENRSVFERPSFVDLTITFNQR